MNILKSILAFLGMLLGGMAGGQGKLGGKAPRRFFAPLVALGFGASIKFRWKYLVFLSWIVIFSMGYGVDSDIFRICMSNETLTRIVYAVLVATPFFVFGWFKALLSMAAIVIAFQVRAGSIGNIGWFGDLLIEDMARYGVWAICVIVNVLTDKD